MTRILQIHLGQFSDRGVKPVNEDFYGAIIPEGEALKLKGAALRHRRRNEFQRTGSLGF